MKRTKKFLALLLAVCLCSGLCACSDDVQEPEQDTPSKNETAEPKTTCPLSLPVAHSDTLDPFKAESAVNRSLITLLFDPLVTVGADFQPELILADSYSLDGKTLSITLKKAYFTDSSAITAADVEYSFEKAKKSDYYAARLSNISSVSGSGSTVVFSLKSADILALSCLDFPIVKDGTVQTKHEGTNLYDIAPPVGSGRYYLKGTLPNATLVANTKNVRGFDPYITEINLFEVTDSDGMAYGLQIGNYDCWYNDLSSGEYTRVNAGLSVVPTNNFVYLAFNPDKTIFQQTEVRRAVSLLLDRESIVSMGFQGHAAACVLPFNPAWSSMKNIAANTTATAQTQTALDLLEGAGYTNINGYGYRASRTKSLNCTLTVCADNPFKVAAAKQIKEQLAAVNFNVRILELGYKDYTQAIANGEFEMYLGEIKIPANMDLSAFFSHGGAANAVMEAEAEDGYWEINPSVDAYGKFVSGSMSLADFCLLFDRETPFVPVCYRNAVQVYSRNFTTEISGTCYDNFYGINKWQTKTSKDSTGGK